MAITHPYLYNFVHYTESERFDCPDRFFFLCCRLLENLSQLDIRCQRTYARIFSLVQKYGWVQKNSPLGETQNDIDISHVKLKVLTCSLLIDRVNDLTFHKKTYIFEQYDTLFPSPPWANDSTHELFRIQRLALESDYVSNHLHQWADLIFR